MSHDETSNLAVAYLEHKDETLDEYDGICGELVDGMMHWLGEGKIRILYLKGEGLMCRDLEWSYHMVAVIDGLVHDAWFPNLLLPPSEYVRTAFPKTDVEFSFPAEASI